MVHLEDGQPIGELWMSVSEGVNACAEQDVLRHSVFHGAEDEILDEPRTRGSPRLKRLKTIRRSS